MKNKQKHIGKTSGMKAFTDYLKGRLSKPEQHQFERAVMSDPFEADAFDGLSRLSEKELHHDMKLLGNRLNIRKNKGSNRIWLVSAASIALVLGFISIFFWITPLQKNEQIAILKPLEKDSIQIMIKPVESTSTEVNDLGKAKLPSTKKADVDDLVSTGKSKTLTVVTDNTLDTSPITPVVEEPITAKERAVKSEIIGMPIQTAEVFAKEMEIDESDPPNIRIRGIQSGTQSMPEELTASKILQGKVSGVKTTNDQMNTSTLVIKGYVLDDTRHPLPGVSIVQRKTGKATVSNLNGYFELVVPAGEEQDAPLTASFIGYETYEFKPRNDTTKIVLNSNMLALDEVVVVGYGTREKESFGTDYTSAKPLMGYSAFRKKVIEQVKSLNLPVESDNRLVIKITISPLGNAELVEIIRTPYEPLNDEIIAIIKSTGQWEPAKHNNIPVNETQRLTFRVK